MNTTIFSNEYYTILPVKIGAILSFVPHIKFILAVAPLNPNELLR